MQRLLLVLALFGLVHAVTAVTFPVKISVDDSSGAVLKDELVIVQDLDNREHEIIRALSDQSGNVPQLELAPGLYRVIATTPYGNWQTSIREFLVTQQPIQIIVKVQPMATHGYGDIDTVPTTRAQLQVIGPDGEPASGARILVRDRDAKLHLERWYSASTEGKAIIDLVDDPTVVVIVYSGVLQTTELTQDNPNPVIRLPMH
jgi:hypothetical protein